MRTDRRPCPAGPPGTGSPGGPADPVTVPAGVPRAPSYGQELSSHTAWAAASLLRFSAVSLMFDVVSQDEW